MANAKKIRATLRASDRALEVMPRNSSLSAKERAEVSQLQAEAIKADTEAALARPSEPTPKQLKAQQRDQQARDRLKLNRPSPVTSESSSDYLAAEGKKIKPLKSEKNRPMGSETAAETDRRAEEIARHDKRRKDQRQQRLRRQAEQRKAEASPQTYQRGVDSGRLQERERIIKLLDTQPKQLDRDSLIQLLKPPPSN